MDINIKFDKALLLACTVVAAGSLMVAHQIEIPKTKKELTTTLFNYTSAQSPGNHGGNSITTNTTATTDNNVNINGNNDKIDSNVSTMSKNEDIWNEIRSSKLPCIIDSFVINNSDAT